MSERLGPMCPRCNGQFIRDMHEGVACLQCGYSPPPPDLLDLPSDPRMTARYKKRVLRVDPRDFFQVE